MFFHHHSQGANENKQKALELNEVQNPENYILTEVARGLNERMMKNKINSTMQQSQQFFHRIILTLAIGDVKIYMRTGCGAFSAFGSPNN